MSTIYDPTLNMYTSIANLFSEDANPQVPKTNAPVQQGQTIKQPDYLSTQQHISTIAPKAQQWNRKDWRRWRKEQGLSKQEMRNVRAQALVGTQAPHDVSRKELKSIERGVKSQTPGIALYADSGRQAGRKVNQVTNILEGIASRWDGKTPMQVNTNPIEIEEEVIEEEPLPGQVQPASPITYNWGNTVNSYWQGQNEKVLNSLSDDEKRKIAGDDGVITADEARAWQQSIGAGSDMKFGSGTIGAATAKYGNNFNANPFKGYTNPISTKTDDKKVDEKIVKTAGTGVVTQPELKKSTTNNFWDMWGTLAFK